MSKGGDCYEVAAQAVMDDPSLVCVHGTVLAMIKGGTAKVGQRHGHAWVERTEVLEHPNLSRPFELVLCIDRSNGNDAELPQDAFYSIGAVEDIQRYNADQVHELLETTGHYGPWAP